MASRILSIEIGSGLTRVAELDYKVKNPKIYNIFTLPTPPDVLNDGKVTVTNIFVSQLGNALRKRGIATKKAVFVMNSTRVANRNIQIPYVRENRVEDLLNANASDYFPVDMDQYQLVHETLGVVEEGGDKKLSLSVLAIPRELIESYRTLARACGLALEGLDYIGNSIKKMMVREIQDDVKATLKVEENNSILTIIENGEIKLQRNINYGVQDAIDAAIDCQLFGYAIDPADAVRELNRRTCLYYSFDKTETSGESADDLDKARLSALRTEITESFRSLIGSAARILDYYQAQNPEKKIDRIYLVGIGSVVSGLSRLMTNELNFKVVANQQYSDISLNKNILDESIHLAEYFTAVGTALNPFSLDISEKKAERAAGEEASAEKAGGISWPFAVLVTGLCIIGAAVMAIYAIGINSLLTLQKTQLTAQVSSLSYIEDVIATYDAAKADADWAAQVTALTESDNDNLVALIGELEDKMPSEINILTLSASETGLVLNIEVGSKEAAADVISQLRTFETISVGAVSTIAESSDGVGTTTVSFSVTCNYADAAVVTAEETTASDDSADESTEE